MVLEAGSRVGEFSVIRRLGAGAVGEVWLAEQTALHRTVALKVLAPGYSSDPSLVERFRREALLAARLRHGAIVPVFAAGDHEGGLFIVMDYIEGRSLDKVLKDLQKRGECPGPEMIASLLRLFVDVADALHYAHEEGMLHRDVKPSNILLDRRGRAYLSDFGLARHRFDNPLTVSGDLIGTPRYMAPELLDSRLGPVDRRADVYSLAAALHELITLAPLFQGEGLQELFARIQTGACELASDRNRAVPASLARLLALALSREPAGRPGTARAFADELRDVLAGDLARCTDDSALAALLGGASADLPESPRDTPRPGSTRAAEPASESAHESSRWITRLPGGEPAVAAAGVVLAWSWMGSVSSLPDAPSPLWHGAYALAFVGFLAAAHARPGGGERRARWLWILRLASLGTCLWVLGSHSDVRGLLVVLTSGLIVVAHVLYDRWIHRGDWALAIAASLPLLIAVVVEAAFARSPLKVGVLNVTGLVAIFSVASGLAVLPVYCWPDLPRPPRAWLLRLFMVGLPASALFLGLTAVLR